MPLYFIEANLASFGCNSPTAGEELLYENLVGYVLYQLFLPGLCLCSVKDQCCSNGKCFLLLSNQSSQLEDPGLSNDLPVELAMNESLVRQVKLLLEREATSLASTLKDQRRVIIFKEVALNSVSSKAFGGHFEVLKRLSCSAADVLNI